MIAARRVATGFAILAFVVVVAIFWHGYDRVDGDILAAEPGPISFATQGRDAGRGNLLGVQVWMHPTDYANEQSFSAKLAIYMQAAKDKGWLSAKTVAIFPEYIGTWLIAAGEKRSVYAEATSAEAMRTVALTHLPELIYRWVTAPDVDDKIKWALFTVKSEQAAATYQQAFGDLARQYGVFIVAGSIVLPEPELNSGRLVVRPGGRLFNVSAVFDPQGRVLPPLVVKAFPIEAEKEFIAAGSADALPVFDTAAGRLGVLICADAWYPASYAQLEKAGARLLAVPSYAAGERTWSLPWGGYNGGAAPADVNTGDIGRISEADAWLKYAMPARAPAAGIVAGLNVFLRGELWDLGSDGATIITSLLGSERGVVTRNAVLSNLWLP